MLLRNSIRCFSTRVIGDKLSNALQSSSGDERQAKLVQFIKTSLRQGETVYSNFANDIIQRWAIEQPTTEALWTCETNTNHCQKLTFNDIYVQSSRLANVLTGKEFNLTAGKTVLVFLPTNTKELILLQLACLQTGLIFCPYDPKDFTESGIPQRIQKLSVDCVITNKDNLEPAIKYTHNPLRPLKKGFITTCSISEPSPVGWSNLLHSANNAESKYTKKTTIHPTTPAIRFLSNTNQIIQYSQENFNLHLLLTAFWLNTNKTSRLIWMKNENELISFAPWLFGSSIFYKKTENLETILNTFETHPIDTFCGSSIDYQMLDKQPEQQNNIHLKQLFSTESIDPMIKTQWHSLTNLYIHDDYVNLNNPSNFQSILKSLSNSLRQKTNRIDEKNKINSIKTKISRELSPSKIFSYNYPRIQEQILSNTSRM